MTPSRPYFFKAVLDWLIDNQCTPFLVVDATIAGVQVPQAFVEDGQITLNINPSAIANFEADDELISFNARFSGQPHLVLVPMAAVLGLFAKENGQGMAFPSEPAYEDLEATESIHPNDELELIEGFDNIVSEDGMDNSNKSDAQSSEAKAKKRSHLSVVK